MEVIFLVLEFIIDIGAEFLESFIHLTHFLIKVREHVLEIRVHQIFHITKNCNYGLFFYIRIYFGESFLH